MSKATEQLEQQQSKLEKNNKRLNDTNDMLLEITKKQRLMVGSSEQPEVTASTSSEDITNKYRVSIYKKLAALEKQVLENQTTLIDDFNFDDKDAKQMYKLKVKIHSLLEENKSLRDQLSDFQNLHDQIMAEIRLRNLKNPNSEIANNQQQGNSAMCPSPTSTNSFNKDDLKPLQVNVIDSDVDGLKDK
ncbi:hypothetical protein QTP88_019126 [Uroleucon formosanum]